MLHEPIVILAPPRSGSSMTAGLFAQHGVWTGRCRGGSIHNPKGYFENLDVKDLLIQYYGKMEHALDKKCYHPEFYHEVKKLNPKGKWLVKHGAIYWETWNDFNPKFILVRRDIDSCYQSNQDCGFKTSRAVIEACSQAMDIVEDKYGACNVYTDSVVQGDYTSLEEAFSYCEIDFDPQIAEHFINPAYWKHHAS